MFHNLKTKDYETDTTFFSFNNFIFFFFSQSNENLGNEEMMQIQILDEVSLIGDASQTRKTSCGVFMTTEIIYQDSDKKEPLLIPNPSPTGVFNIKFDKDYKAIQLSVYTISGLRIQSKSIGNLNDKSIKVDLSQFPKGIYLIELVADGEKSPTKKAVFS